MTPNMTQETLSAAREICTLHNKQIPAIKEIRAKTGLGLYEAKQLLDQVWSTVQHPLNVEYEYLDRKSVKLVINSLHIKGSRLCLSRSDGLSKFVRLSKKSIQDLTDFGVPIKT